MNKKYAELLSASRELYAPPKQVDNFISNEELKKCIDVYNSLPVFAPTTHNRATRKDYLMTDTTNSVMQDMFLPKFQQLFPDKEIIIDGGNFTNWHDPVKPHTDGYQMQYKSIDSLVNDNSILGFAVLVPLSTDTNQGIPKTIFYHQRFFGEAFSWGDISSSSTIENYTGIPWDAKVSNSDLVDFVPQDMLHGYSIESVLDWNFGSAIIWHRSQVHSSAKFKDFNSKLHLIFFLNFKK